jgi:amino acid transporter
MRLEKNLSRRDVFFFLVCTLVGLDTLGSVASRGGEGFVWLAFLAATFFVPYALLTAELGAAFPQEGGAYLWTRHALGRRVAAITAVFYWVSNPIWLGGALTITALTTWNTFFFPIEGPGRYLFGLVLIWSAIAGTILSFDVGKWITAFGAWSRALLLGFFTASVGLYAARHGVHGVRLPDLAPTYDGFFAVVPLLFFNFVGFELPSAAGDEMVDPKRDVPFAVTRAALAAVLCYGVPILAILVVLPTERITGLKGFIDAMQTVFTVYGGHVETGPDGAP